MDRRRTALIAAPAIGLAIGALAFGDLGLGIVFAAAFFGGALCLVPGGTEER